MTGTEVARLDSRIDDLRDEVRALRTMLEHFLWDILDDADDADAVKHHCIKGLTALAVGPEVTDG